MKLIITEKATIAEQLYSDLPEAGDMKSAEIDVGKIKIAPFEDFDIHEMRIEKELNQHSTLYVYGIVKDDNKDKPVTDMTVGTKIKCENDGVVYFSGVLTNIKITCINATYHLEVYAISNTILLDTEKHKRSFQDNEQTYQSIVETVIKDFDGAVTYNATEKKVENLILQYNETAWEFAQRLASHTQDVLIPVTDDKPAFHFGVPDTGSADLKSDSYSVSKNFDMFRRMSLEAEPLTDDDVKIYTVKMTDYSYELGEKFKLNGTELHICRISLFLADSALTILYTLCTKKAISTPKFYNHAITGLTLNGTVLKAEDDNVKLHLAIDEEQDEGKAHLFKYATGYSTEGHTGWYVMPEIGDTVQLMTPDEDEKNAYAVSSVRQDGVDKSGDHVGNTTDPAVKFLRTSFGKQIKFDEKEILITSKDDETFIRINEETGIEIITPHPVLIHSGSTLNIESEDDMTITTEKNLIVQAKESIEMSCGGNIMKFVPSDGINLTTDKKFELVSEDNATIDSKKEVGVKSGKDLKLDGGGKLLGAGSSAIELTSGGSSVKLASSGVDIKGTMIKEN